MRPAPEATRNKQQTSTEQKATQTDRRRRRKGAAPDPTVFYSAISGARPSGLHFRRGYDVPGKLIAVLCSRAHRRLHFVHFRTPSQPGEADLRNLTRPHLAEGHVDVNRLRTSHASCCLSRRKGGLLVDASPMGG